MFIILTFQDDGESTDSNSESDTDNCPNKRLKFEKNDGPYSSSVNIYYIFIHLLVLIT